MQIKQKILKPGKLCPNYKSGIESTIHYAINKMGSHTEGRQGQL